MRCTNFHNTGEDCLLIKPVRCKEGAEFYVLNPEGTRCPGVRLCRKCAEATVTEYCDNLRQEWMMIPMRSGMEA